MQASYAPRTYWVDDPIDNFRLRVTLYQDGPERADAASLPTQPERADEKESLLGGVSRRRRRARKGDERAAQEASFASQEHASYDSPAAAAPGTRANPYVREFAWQEKVIGPAEVRAYRERERRSALGQGIEALGTGLRSLFAQPAPDTSFRDRSYAEQIAALDDEAQAATGRPFAGEVLHSKVHVDRFVDRRELRARMTTSELEEPSPLTHAVLSGRALEPLPLAPARPGVPAPTPPPYQLMHIVADLGERSQPASAAARARAGEDDDDEQAGPDRTLFVLCTLRAYANGRLDMTPGFSNEGVELEPDLDESGAPPPPGGGAAAGLLAGGGAGGGARAKGWHRLTARDGKVWRFRLDNLAERLVSETERRAERGARVHELIARQNLFGGGTAFTPPPPKGAVVLNVLGELVGAHGFDAASLSAQYFVHVNEGWTVSASSSVHGMTQACLPKWVPAEREYEHIVHFGLPLELTLSNPSWGARGGADDGAGAGLSASGAGSTAAATLFVQLLSRDRFDRHMVEGYGHVAIAPSAGACTHRVRTWRPAASAAASVRRFFVHEVRPRRARAPWPSAARRPARRPIRAPPAAHRLAGRPARARRRPPDHRAGRRPQGDEISDLRYVGVPSGVPSKGLNKYGFASEKAGTCAARAPVGAPPAPGRTRAPGRAGPGDFPETPGRTSPRAAGGARRARALWHAR